MQPARFVQENVTNYDVTCCACLEIVLGNYDNCKICGHCTKTIIHKTCIPRVGGCCPKCREPKDFYAIMPKTKSEILETMLKCVICGLQVCARDVEAHGSVCPKMVVPCAKGCGQLFKRSQEGAHVCRLGYLGKLERCVRKAVKNREFYDELVSLMNHVTEFDLQFNPAPGKWSRHADECGRYQVAVSVDGIWRSKDYGKTWTQTDAPSGSWRGVAVPASAKFQTAVQHRGHIWCSEDRGKTWTRTDAPEGNWVAVAMSADARYQTAVQFFENTDQLYGDEEGNENTDEEESGNETGGVWRSEDYGKTWTETAAPWDSWAAVTQSQDGKYVTIQQHRGGIMRSEDYGENWTETNTEESRQGNITMSGDGQHQVVVCYDRGIWKSGDYGNVWVKTNAPIGRWTAVAMSSDAKHQSAVQSGSISRSEDCGETWGEVLIPAGSPQVIGMSGDGRYQTIAYHSRGIWRSEDFGRTWRESNAPNAIWVDVAVSN